MLLAGLLTSYTASLIPWALAQPVADADRGSFVALSAIIAGRQSLDAAQATRLYDALAADDSGFPAAVRELLALVNERGIDPLQLQRVLDAAHSVLATLPRRIATAWFMGIAGDGEHARCIAFETALNAVIVADVLKPPTYCYGVYGSWSNRDGVRARRSHSADPRHRAALHRAAAHSADTRHHRHRARQERLDVLQRI